MPLIIAYISTTLTFFIIDFIWLGFVAKDFYRGQLGHLMLSDVKLGIAALFYLFYTIGIVVFAIKPALDSQSFITALLYGGLFGFLAYGTYDFTNMATLKDWPFLMSLVDIAWGTLITGTTAVIGYFITKYFSGIIK